MDQRAYFGGFPAGFEKQGPLPGAGYEQVQFRLRAAAEFLNQAQTVNCAARTSNTDDYAHKFALLGSCVPNSEHN
jgi:hypothetical protein